MKACNLRWPLISSKRTYSAPIPRVSTLNIRASIKGYTKTRTGTSKWRRERTYTSKRKNWRTAHSSQTRTKGTISLSTKLLRMEKFHQIKCHLEHLSNSLRISNCSKIKRRSLKPRLEVIEKDSICLCSGHRFFPVIASTNRVVPQSMLSFITSPNWMIPKREVSRIQSKRMRFSIRRERKNYRRLSKWLKKSWSSWKGIMMRILLFSLLLTSGLLKWWLLESALRCLRAAVLTNFARNLVHLLSERIQDAAQEG